MQRPKQQALAFLLGALLVGGVLGFSAGRVLRHHDSSQTWAGRDLMYDDLGLSPAQRAAMDSVLDDRHRQVEAVLAPVKPQLDSIKDNARAQFRRILTPAQWQKLEQRRQEDEARRAAGHRNSERSR